MGTVIRKAAVLGAGVMGSGIAAHLASCGVRTILYDIVPPNLDASEREDRAARDRWAQAGLDNALKSRPALFLDKGAASIVEIGNLDDDLDRLRGCDWIIEVVKEDMGIKRDLLAKVEAHWTPGTIVTSNTSGLSIDGMLEGRGDDFKRHFFGTHFFNPVRYMHLLEIIPGTATDPAHIDATVTFIREVLGKGVVFAKDTPNFIANRIGVYAMMKTIGSMRELGYTIEEVDAIVGRPMGRPKSAAFRTADVVGIDTFVHVSQNCFDSLPDDPEREVFAIPSFLKGMVDKRLLGQKTRAGFYKKDGKVIYTLDLDTLEYREPQPADLPELKKLKKLEDPGERIKALVAGDDRAARFAWHVLSASLAYAANIAFDIADDIVNIDRGMRWGFNWDLGPFETWQALGVAETAARLRADGHTLPAWIDEAIAAGGFYLPAEDGTTRHFAPGQGLAPEPVIPGSLSLKALKATGGVVEKNRGATLIDLGDGIACLEFHTKMNTVDTDVTAMLNTACDIVERDFDGLVLANEAEHFSAGANLMMIVMQANQKKWADIENAVATFQATIQRLKYLSKPVVSNPHGLTLGGGCEMAMAADRMMVAQECYMGLVEVGVGLIPGGCGTLNLLKRVFQHVPAERPQSFDPLPLIQRAFEAIGMAKVATGAGEVFSLGFGTPLDEIAINRDTRIHDAKRLARYLADRGYTAPRPAQNLFLPGANGAAAISLFVYGMQLSGWASEHDKKIADKLGRVLTGGDTDGRSAVSEERVIELEREAFMSLCGEQKTIERMQYMLMNNKPLRN